jgi:ABC-type glutathione transport system ATPase component
VTALLEGRGLVKEFKVKGETVTALDGVDLRVERGSSFGLVGESGSGKTTLIRSLLRLTEPTRGETFFDGTDLGALRAREMRAVRRRIGVVFQNPVLALDPRMRVRESVAEPLRTHGRLRGADLDRAVTKLLDDVGLPASYADRLPHQLSGGQCQRVGIARALSTQPDLLVLDEPTSALDVSVQAQILNLLRELRESRDLTYLLVSHDLDVIGYMSDHVAVMYRGRVVEEGPTDRVLGFPQDDYTALLLAARPGARREAHAAGGAGAAGAAGAAVPMTSETRYQG